MESMKEMVEKRAYHLFLKRNGAHGYHMQDWVQAEKEIKAELEAKKKGDVKQPVASASKVTAPAPGAAPAAKSNQAVRGRKKGGR